MAGVSLLVGKSGLIEKGLGVLAGQSNRLLRNPALFGTRAARRDFSSRVRVAGSCRPIRWRDGNGLGRGLGGKRDCPWAAALTATRGFET